MPDRHPATLILCCFMPSGRASSITGDLLEEGRGRAGMTFWIQLAGLVSRLLWARTVEALLQTVGMAMLVTGAASLVTSFLLVPLSLVHVDVQELPFMVVVFCFRALACFVVAAVMADIFGHRASAGTMYAALGMLGIMILRLAALQQELWLPGPSILGTVQTVVFYVPCTAVALLAGSVYGAYCRELRLQGPRSAAG